MKDWMKATIRENGIGYLSILRDEVPQLMLFPYVYDKGHLKCTISVLRADIIRAIERIPFVNLVIINNDIEIQISGKIHLLDDNLDYDWTSYQNQPLIAVSTHELQTLNRVPHVHKQVILDLIPEQIKGKRGNITVKYELEIL